MASTTDLLAPITEPEVLELQDHFYALVGSGGEIAEQEKLFHPHYIWSPLPGSGLTLTPTENQKLHENLTNDTHTLQPLAHLIELPPVDGRARAYCQGDFKWHATKPDGSNIDCIVHLATIVERRPDGDGLWFVMYWGNGFEYLPGSAELDL